MKVFVGETEVTGTYTITKGSEVNFIGKCFDENGKVIYVNKNMKWYTDAPWNNARFITSSARGLWITGKKVGGVYTATVSLKDDPSCSTTFNFEVK